MSDNTMTRNDDSNAVVVIRHSDGSCRGWFAEFSGDLTVSACFSVRNLQQFTPDSHLKRRSLKIQREVELRSIP